MFPCNFLLIGTNFLRWAYSGDYDMITSPATTSEESDGRRFKILSTSPHFVAACRLGMLFLNTAISNPKIST